MNSSWPKCGLALCQIMLSLIISSVKPVVWLHQIPTVPSFRHHASIRVDMSISSATSTGSFFIDKELYTLQSAMAVALYSAPHYISLLSV
jgi:hypothetical protein